MNTTIGPWTDFKSNPDLGELDDSFDARLALSASGLLQEFNRAGFLIAADVHIARRIGELCGERDDSVLLALACATRAVRGGEAAADLAALEAAHPALPWPEGDWIQRTADSQLTKANIIHVEDGLVYLDRYFRDEQYVASQVAERVRVREPMSITTSDLEAALARLIPDENAVLQRLGVTRALTQYTSVLTGGPGTGKTTTLAAAIAVINEIEPEAKVALAAPTAKAAQRMKEAIAEAFTSRLDKPLELVPEATTIHRMLGSGFGVSSGFRRNARNPLPHDLVIIDEASMLSLSLTARIFEALRPETRLILVGDQNQLASVEAGNILGDIIDGTSSQEATITTVLEHNFRSEKNIQKLADAIVSGDDAGAFMLLEEVEGCGSTNDGALKWLQPTTEDLDLVANRALNHARELQRLASLDDESAALAALNKFRLLCAHRKGPWGVATWNRKVEKGLGLRSDDEYYVGRPLLVTANTPSLGLFNGDTGVVMNSAGNHVAVFSGANDSLGPRRIPVTRLSNVETMHAMTIHKAQGSEANEVVVILPDADSPLLTRELLYTGVTRAKKSVTIVGTKDSVRSAVNTRTKRVSGLARRIARERGERY